MHAGSVRWRRAGSDCRRSERFWCLSKSRSVCRRLAPLSPGLSLASGSLSAAATCTKRGMVQPAANESLVLGASRGGVIRPRAGGSWCCRRCFVVICRPHVSPRSVGCFRAWLSADPVLQVIRLTGRLGCGCYCLGCGPAEFGRPALDVRPEPVASWRSSAGMWSGMPRGGGTKTGYGASAAAWAAGSRPRRARR